MQTENRPGPYSGTYDDLAPEYYDIGRHPTSANFREASRNLLIPWLRELIRPARILEVGAGCSIVSEWLTEEKRSVALFIAADRSLNMLRYSIDHDSQAGYVVCDAQQLPFAANSFDLVVSSLGDPYNTILFWGEVSRVLRVGAHVLFTTPSLEWAQQFRNGDTHAEFVTSRGQILAVPSYVASMEAQRAMIERAKLTLSRHRDIQESQLTATVRSPKLRPGSIVSGYDAVKKHL